MPLAMNGDSGLKYVADEIPDLILLDIMKPDIDGYVAYRRLKPIPEQT
jgi:CheY-like chemotaxis protein